MADLDETEATMAEMEMDSDDDNPTARSEQDSSEDEDTEVVVDEAKLGISRVEVEENYLRMGEEVEEEKTSLNLADLRKTHPQAFTTESEALLSAVLEDLQLPYMLSDYQA